MSKLIRHEAWWLGGGVKGLIYSLKKPKTRKFIHKNVPYYAQWATSKLVDHALEHPYQPIDDPYWRISGAKNKKEYLHWSWNGCGITCFKMVLQYMTGKKVPMVTLGKQALSYGAYKIDKQAYKTNSVQNSLPGLFYQEFTNFINDQYHLKGRVISPMIFKAIILELSKGNLVMASVNGAIRDPKSNPHHKGGHIVLVLGYDLDHSMLYLHNPSGFYNKSQSYAKINFIDFKRFFARRGIIIYKDA